MIDSARLCLVTAFLLGGLVYTGEVIYYSRRAVQARSEWKGRIWILGIFGIVGYAAFMLFIWFPHYVPQLRQWSMPLGIMMFIGIPTAIAHRILLRRILH